MTAADVILEAIGLLGFAVAVLLTATALLCVGFLVVDGVANRLRKRPA